LHELGHIAAARLARVAIREIRLMPFGGSARMENPYGLSPLQLIVTASGGPTANLCALVLSSALAGWGWLNPLQAQAFALSNLALMLFNLFPALPLDGGRILYAALSAPLGPQRALKNGIILGRCLALALAAAFIAGGFRRGVWNLSFLLAAVFIFCSEADEKRALQSAAVHSFHPQAPDDRLHPARIYHVESDTSARRALMLLKPRERAWFILTRNGVPGGLMDSAQLARQLIQSDAPDPALNDLPYYRISSPQPSGAF